MIGKQLLNNIQEFFMPKLKLWFYRKTRDKIKNSIKVKSVRSQEDLKLINYEGLFDEYLEMVIQFGFITIFVAAFPLAPFLALINNWIEIRLDAHKIVCETRRTVPERAKNIGIWFSILTFVIHLAVISNVSYSICFTQINRN